MLTGAQMAVIVLSPKQKVFTFGHPNADVVIDQYLAGKGSHPASQALVSDYHKDNEEYLEVLEKMEAEKKRSEEISNEEKLRGGCDNNNSGGGFWWCKDVGNMGLMELENFMESLKELKNNVELKADEKANMGNLVMKNEANFYDYGYGYF